MAPEEAVIPNRSRRRRGPKQGTFLRALRIFASWYREVLWGQVLGLRERSWSEVRPPASKRARHRRTVLGVVAKARAAGRMPWVVAYCTN